MELLTQRLEDIVSSLRPLSVDWKDETALRAIAGLQSLPTKRTYKLADLHRLFSSNFADGLLISRLFLGLSKDQFEASF